MTGEEAAREAAAINFEITIAHGLGDCRVGFVWRDIFIHDPFTDPQYGFYYVDSVCQYGEAYLNSIFATDPSKALESAEQQLRDEAHRDFAAYCIDHNLDVADQINAVEEASSVRVPESDDLLATLTDGEVARVWAHVDQVATKKCRIWE